MGSGGTVHVGLGAGVRVTGGSCVVRPAKVHAPSASAATTGTLTVAWSTWRRVRRRRTREASPAGSTPGSPATTSVRSRQASDSRSSRSGIPVTSSVEQHGLGRGVHAEGRRERPHAV